MNKYLIILFVIGSIFLSFILFKPKPNILNQEVTSETDTPKEQNLFGDDVNGWEIKYPSEVTDIRLADEIGPRTNRLGNYLFSIDRAGWIFGITYEKTEHTDLEALIKNNPSDLVIEGYTTVSGVRAVIRTWPDEVDRKNISFIKRNIWFTIYTNAGQDYEKIIKNFRFLN